LAGGWLSGRYRKGVEIEESLRARRIPGRYDLSMPENQRKLDVADRLANVADEAGLTLVHLAIAFVLEHPGVTSAIIGPRTMDQLTSQLDAADVKLSSDVLDEIDRIVPPGTNLNDADAGYAPPSITAAWRRRRGAR
ncbi:MAG TPA: aldo/keto reductase, partial [Nocardioidaceae bacterium]|nr:aldo/keto reductase [Nocardioidaceae bacterium]